MSIDGIKNTNNTTNRAQATKIHKHRKEANLRKSKKSQLRKRVIFITLSVFLVIGITIAEIRINWDRIINDASKQQPQKYDNTLRNALHGLQGQFNYLKESTNNAFQSDTVSTSTTSSTIPTVNTEVKPKVQGATTNSNSRLPE